MGGSSDLDNAGLGAVLKTALDAVVVMRCDGTIAGWNEVAERTFGWTFAEARGRLMSDLIIPPRYRDAHERGLKHFLATGEGPVLDRHIEIEALDRAGRELPVELSITPSEQFGELVFLGFLRDISERKEAARRQELLIGELNHRVKNMLGVVAAIAHRSVRSARDLDEFGEAFSGRIAALGRAYDLLTGTVWEPSSLAALLGSLAQPYQADPPRIAWSGDDVRVSPRQLITLGLIFHEMLTNAAKYGALAQAGGSIAIRWRTEDGLLRFEWTECGADASGAAPGRRGFGTRLIDLSVTRDLKGRIEREWDADGLRCRLEFPLG